MTKKLSSSDRKPIESNLTGAEIVSRIQKGHMVRRSCWRKGHLIRITNERGFDKDGNAVFDRDVALYTICTDGYFLHFAWSSQPFVDKKSGRDGEGISMLFERDWEDYGFISRDDFEELTQKSKEKLCKGNRIAGLRIEYDRAIANRYFKGTFEEYIKAVENA